MTFAKLVVNFFHNIIFLTLYMLRAFLLIAKVAQSIFTIYKLGINVTDISVFNYEGKF